VVAGWLVLVGELEALFWWSPRFIIAKIPRITAIATSPPTTHPV
jgi:hypothetical protein